MTEIFVKVHPAVFSYYRNLHGSERIRLKNDPILTRRIKTILQTKPKRYSQTRFSNFRILVLELHNFRIANKRINIKNVQCLDDRVQYFLSRELQDYFDEKFTGSVAGYCSALNMKPGCQKMGIEDFMFRYNIDPEEISFQTLKKKWDRSDDKQTLLNNVKIQSGFVTPLSLALNQ